MLKHPYSHYHADGQQKTQEGEDDAHQDEEVVHLGQELPRHDHGLLVCVSHVTDVLYYHPVLYCVLCNVMCNVVMLTGRVSEFD